MVLLMKELMAVLFSRAETWCDYKNTVPLELSLSSPDWPVLGAVYKLGSSERALPSATLWSIYFALKTPLQQETFLC
jgi:hypothetical protein